MFKLYTRIMVAVIVTAVVLTNGVILAQGTSLLGEETYSLEVHTDGTVRANVDVAVDWSNQAVRDEYAQRKHLEAREIGGIVGNIPVQVTFTRPLSMEEIRNLVNQLQFQPEHILMEARDANNRLHTVGTVAEGTQVMDISKLLPGLNEHNLQIVGVTVLEGQVPVTSLAQLSADERVYIPDVTPYTLAVKLAESYNLLVEQVDVFVPSPHWVLSSER